MNNQLVNSINNNYKNCISYTFQFEPISATKGHIHFINNLQNQEKTIGFSINDKDFGYRVENQFPTIIADLVDLTVAIYACDRLANHELQKTQRCISVTLPLRHPELFNSNSFQEKLNSLLIWMTESEWLFKFKKRKIPGRYIEQQLSLSLPITNQNTEVALWSGGLDSLAGLYNRLTTKPDNSFILFGSGSNKKIYSDQKKLFQEIEYIFPNNISLLRVPIYFDESKNIPKNKLSRGRGILFTLLGSACAYLMGQRKLFIYENGIGAINLPYSKATIGLDHSRSVHPKTLLMVSDLVSELIGENFEVKNPFLFWTKAQMCQLLAENKENNLVRLTASCDHPHRKTVSQCGYCSSCILRRQALIVANLEDKTDYVITHSKKPPEKDRSLYFRCMQKQVKTLDRLLQKSNKKNRLWKDLTKEFLELDDIVDQTYKFERLSRDNMRNHLVKLYETYVCEWKMTEFILEKEF